MKQNALRMAAKNYLGVDKSIIDLLIKKGVDVICQDKVTCLYSKLKTIHNVNFRMEKRLIKWQVMVKSELSFDSITYVIISI